MCGSRWRQLSVTSSQRPPASGSLLSSNKERPDSSRSIYPALVERLLGSGSGGNEPPKPTVGVATIKATGGPTLIETESDVDAYLAVLRTALVQAINDGKRITL